MLYVYVTELACSYWEKCFQFIILQYNHEYGPIKEVFLLFLFLLFLPPPPFSSLNALNYSKFRWDTSMICI